LYAMLFAGGHIQEAAIKALKNPGPELRSGLDFKIVFLLSRAETEGKLHQAVELLSERARMSQSAITENLTPSMEGKVRAILAQVEAANMKKVGTTPEVVRAAFEEFSVPPEKLAVSLLQKEGVRVLAIGEVHGLNSPHRKFVSSMMDELNTAGATHLAVELPTSMQADLNEALKIASGAPADIKPLQDLILSFNADATMGDKSFIDLLVSARKAGLEVVAVDGPMADFEVRDKIMADTIQGILNGNEHHKVVFFAGAEHTALDTPNSSGKTPSAVQLLGASGILAKTIVEQDGRSINAALKHIGQTLATPSGVYTWGIAGLDSLPLSLDIIRGRRLENWDAAIVYPSP